MKEDLKDLQRIINSDKAVIEWFKSVNNERTVYDYRADFPNFEIHKGKHITNLPTGHFPSLPFGWLDLTR